MLRFFSPLGTQPAASAASTTPETRLSANPCSRASSLPTWQAGPAISVRFSAHANLENTFAQAIQNNNPGPLQALLEQARASVIQDPTQPLNHQAMKPYFEARIQAQQSNGTYLKGLSLETQKALQQFYDPRRGQALEQLITQQQWDALSYQRNPEVESLQRGSNTLFSLSNRSTLLPIQLLVERADAALSQVVNQGREGVLSSLKKNLLGRKEPGVPPLSEPLALAFEQFEKPPAVASVAERQKEAFRNNHIIGLATLRNDPESLHIAEDLDRMLVFLFEAPEAEVSYQDKRVALSYLQPKTAQNQQGMSSLLQETAPLSQDLQAALVQFQQSIPEGLQQLLAGQDIVALAQVRKGLNHAKFLYEGHGSGYGRDRKFSVLPYAQVKQIPSVDRRLTELFLAPEGQVPRDRKQVALNFLQPSRPGEALGLDPEIPSQAPLSSELQTAMVDFSRGRVRATGGTTVPASDTYLTFAPDNLPTEVQQLIQKRDIATLAEKRTQGGYQNPLFQLVGGAGVSYRFQMAVVDFVDNTLGLMLRDRTIPTTDKAKALQTLRAFSPNQNGIPALPNFLHQALAAQASMMPQELLSPAWQQRIDTLTSQRDIAGLAHLLTETQGPLYRSPDRIDEIPFGTAVEALLTLASTETPSSQRASFEAIQQAVQILKSSPTFQDRVQEQYRPALTQLGRELNIPLFETRRRFG
ncbi:MAG: hypothetical protein SFZ03_11625 [Candidatus Melainabacteria bacterium]|nr:hypothetical protein [Candidatus Melainabacteria bacterium]